MSSWGTARARIATALAAFAVLACAPAAQAASGPAAVTVTACKGDAMALLGRVKPTGKAASKVRGAKLQIRFSALPLFGLPKRGAWRDLGTKRSGSGAQTFTGLASDSWIGVVSFRFRKGSRTVFSGTRRSEAVRIGSTKGRAFCTLDQGFRLLDKTPPELFPVPGDELWYRGPTKAWVVARDEYPGVAKVFYRLDGGAITNVRNGESISIDAEGTHTLDWGAADVDGNTGFRTVLVRVDTSAPSKPQLQRPSSATASTQPTFQWTPSTDSGSGLRGYALTINRASDGAQVAQTFVDPSTTSAAPASLQDGVAYTAVVTAVDNTSDGAFTTSSDPISFRVDTTPEVTATDPPQGSVLAGVQRLTLTLDRSADPSTVTPANVVLNRTAGSGSAPGAYQVSCSDACTKVAVDPSSLPEGRYALVLTERVKTADGDPFVRFTLKFAVRFYGPSAASTPSGNCTLGPPSNSSMTTTLNAAPNETIRISFNWAVSGTGTGYVRVLETGNPNPVGTSTPRSAGSGTDTFEVTLSSASNHALTFELATSGCSGTQSIDYDVTNLTASRTP